MNDRPTAGPESPPGAAPTAPIAQVPDVAGDLDDLRRPGAVLLVSCYELGHLPHGLTVPRGFLERAGFSPACVDVSIQSLPDALIDQARVVAISVPMHTALRMGVRVARRVRARNPGARIGFFGLYAPLNADYLEREGAAFAMGGECEDELLAWLEARTRGLATARSGSSLGLIRLAKLDFPAPAHHDLPALSRYAHFDPGDGACVPVGYVETSRGCLDTCRHCPVPAVYQGRFFVIPIERVLEEIELQVAGGARHISFGDPDFLNGPGHAMRVVRALHRRWPELTFDITAQVSHLARHARLLPELRALGCAFVVSAVESLSDRVLEKLHKRHRLADFLDVLDRCRQAGLVVRPTFVTFTPWTELEDLRALVDFLVREELCGQVDAVQLSIRLLVPPGSLLLSAADTRDAFGELDAQALTHVWHHRDPRVDQLQRDIAACVAQAAGQTTGQADRGQPPEHTFAAVRRLVYRALGEPDPPALSPACIRPAPRLTEPWFC
jgi:hypothetical protein